MSDISASTLDSNGVARLLDNTILSSQFVDIGRSEFGNPGKEFSGYAADGFYYSGGISDPTVDSFKASWAQEGEHSEATSDRGLLDRFPDRIFVVATPLEVVILNADDLTVWMRFTKISTAVPPAPAGGAALGGSECDIRSAEFQEGYLFVSTSKGMRLINFIEDNARYITTAYTFYGEGLRDRNSSTFYTTKEFEPEEPVLNKAWVTPSDHPYTPNKLNLFLPLENDTDGDLSGTSATLTMTTSSTDGTGNPQVVVDSPFGAFSGAPTTCLEFNNNEDSDSLWEGSFAYLEDSSTLSPHPLGSSQPFTIAVWVKPAASIGTWGDRSRDLNLCSKVVIGTEMRNRFSLPNDTAEFQLYINTDGDVAVSLYKENDTATYARIKTNLASATGSPTVPNPSDDVWTHIAVTFDPAIDIDAAGAVDAGDSPVRFYINGSLVNDANYGCTGSYHVAKIGALFHPWTYMANTDAPLFIGNSGSDPGHGSTTNRGNYFDGRMAYLGMWGKVLTPVSVSALYRSGADGGVFPVGGGAEPASLTSNQCRSLSTTFKSGTAIAAIGHNMGLTILSKERDSYPTTIKNSFNDTASVTYDIGTTSTDMKILSAPGGDLDSNGWEAGDLVYCTDTFQSRTIEAVYDERLIVSPEFTTTRSPSAGTIQVTRGVTGLLVKDDTLYLAHGLRKVSRDASTWWSAPFGSGIFDFVTTTVSLSDLSSIRGLAESGGTLYMATDIGVFHITDEMFNSESQGAPLLYSTESGSGIYKIIQGTADSCTAVGIDPETGHLLVANDDGRAPSVTEIDTSIHQAFQFFDANSTPAVTETVSVITTYRNVNGPPDVEVD